MKVRRSPVLLEVNTWFLDTNLMRTLPQLFLWGSRNNLHDCISTLVISGISLSSAPTFQHILHRSIDLKLVSDSCCCNPCWWGVPNSTLQRRWTSKHSPLPHNTSVTSYIHRMIISQPCLFKHMNDESVSMIFQCLLDHTQQKLHFCLISLLRNNVSKSVHVNLSRSL